MNFNDCRTLLPGSTLARLFPEPHLTELAHCFPPFLSKLRNCVFSSGWTHGPPFIPGMYNFYYFWKACLRSRKFLCHTSWAVVVEWGPSNGSWEKQGIYFLSGGWREKDIWNVLKWKRPHWCFSLQPTLSDFRSCCTSVGVCTEKSEIPSHSCPSAQAQGPSGPPYVLANCPSLRLLASVHGNLSVCG